MPSSSFFFVIEGSPVPWMRTNRVGGRALTPAKQRSYQKVVAASALSRRPHGWSLVGRYRVEVHVYPKARRGDIDNFLKSVMDSLNGIAYSDDCQVDEIHAARAIDAKRPRVEVLVSLLPG